MTNEMNGIWNWKKMLENKLKIIIKKFWKKYNNSMCLILFKISNLYIKLIIWFILILNKLKWLDLIWIRGDKDACPSRL